MAIRRLLHAAGYRYRVDYRPLKSLNRRADIAFTRLKIAVFVDGCFWHGCPEHHTKSKSNSGFWADKVQRNRERDADTNRAMALAGWAVIRVWEHEDVHDVVKRITDAVRARAET